MPDSAQAPVRRAIPGGRALVVEHDLIDAIRRGTKTTVRLPARADAPRCPYEPVKHYAVRRRRGGPEALRVEVVRTRRERLGALTDAGARAEGHRSRDAFLSHWYGRHQHVDVEQLVWVLDVVVYDPPRWLRRVGSGYTSDPRLALLDEPEALDPGALATLVRAPTPASAPRTVPTRRRGAIDELEDRLQAELLNMYEGWEPEDVSANAPHQGTPGDVRARRRRIGRRAIDGLAQLDEAAAAAVLERMAGDDRCSVRDVARALDVSTGKAHTLLAERRPQAA